MALPLRVRQRSSPADLSIEIERSGPGKESAELQFGERFELTVRRRWPATMTTEDFDLASLAPLEVKLEERTSQRSASTIDEVLRIYAWAIDTDTSESGRVEIPSVALRAVPRDGGATRTTRSTALSFALRTPDVERPVERPRDLYPPTHRQPWLAIGASGLGLAGVAWFIARRQRLRAQRLAERVDLATATRTRVAALRAQATTDRETWHDEARELSSLVRRWLASHFGVAATTSDTESLLRDLDPSIAGETRDAFSRALHLTDRAKFERYVPSDQERVELYEQIDKILEHGS